MTTTLYQDVLDLRRADPVAAHIDDIIKAPGDLVVSLLRAIGAVAREIVTYARAHAHVHTRTHKQAFEVRLMKLVRCWREGGGFPTRIRQEVGLNEPLVVVVDSAGHAGPRLRDTQGPRRVVAPQRVSLQGKTQKDQHE